ncbi:hypothetical protein WUBG_01906 [Wuchereria bancrofti]|uniref:Uncharacterized protein n=1 Tax=Wuchereria bancrofti TaxID=6293 RepID=J9EY71_WUCBA|nr:hypothetical protein WUBG_01906 [Wuchereria bancrofti]
MSYGTASTSNLKMECKDVQKRVIIFDDKFATGTHLQIMATFCLSRYWWAQNSECGGLGYMVGEGWGCGAVTAVGKRSSGGGSTPYEWDPETWFGSPLTSHFCRASTIAVTPIGGRLISQLDAGAPENEHQHCDDMDWIIIRTISDSPTPTNDDCLTGVSDTCHDSDDNARPGQLSKQGSTEQIRPLCLHLLRPFCVAPTDVDSGDDSSSSDRDCGRNSNKRRNGGIGYRWHQGLLKCRRYWNAAPAIGETERTDRSDSCNINSSGGSSSSSSGNSSSSSSSR